ncbi:MAG: hypothetical protein LBD70_00275 [Bifidobacteriaceae bacterium]|jgi:hypothetical protein|nr:hypothetical protein [Bifidobacteriaceae bacterium]
MFVSARPRYRQLVSALAGALALAVVGASPALAAGAAEPADQLAQLVSAGAAVAASGEIVEAVAHPSGEVTRYLVTEDGIGLQLDDAALPTEVANGDQVEAVVEIPGELVAELAGGEAAAVAVGAEDIPAGPLDQSSEAGAVLLEAAADAGLAVGLAQAAVAQPAPAADLPAAGAHHLRFVFMSAAGLGKFLDSAALDEYVDQLEAYWIRESHGVIPSFTYSWEDSVALTSTAHCPGTLSNIVAEAAAALGTTRAAASASRNHLIVLSPNSERLSCSAYQTISTLGTLGLASGGLTHQYLDAGSGSSEPNNTVRAFGFNLSLKNAGTGTCPAGVVDGPFTSQGPCTVDHDRDDDYGDYRNVMGFGSAADTTLNGYQKFNLGLISADHGLIDAVSDLDREFILAPSSTTDLEVGQTIRVIDHTDALTKQYWVDYDLQAGGIAIRRDCKGVSDPGCESGTRTSPATRILSPGTTTASAPRQVFIEGETFVSQTGGFRLQVGSLTETGATVRVTLTNQSTVILLRLVETAPYHDYIHSFAVTSLAGRWSAVSNAPSWMSVSPRSGKSGDQATVTSAANLSPTPRTGTVTFTSGGYSTDFTVTQSGLPDDHGSTTATATNWDLGNQSLQFGRMEWGNDIDYFTFTAPVSGRYSFTSESSDNVSGYFYDSTGSQLDWDADSGPGANFKLTPTLTAGNVYYLAVRLAARSSRALPTMAYTVTAVVPPLPSLAIDRSSWSPAQTGGSISLTPVTNQDRWTVSSSASWLTFSSRSGSPGKTITVTAPMNQSTQAREAVATFTAGGAIVQLAVFQAGATDDHGSTAATATLWDLAASASVSGSLEIGGDIDYFKITAPVSGKYTFTSNAIGNPSGYLYSAAGSQLASNTDSGPGYNFQLTPTLTAGATYYLAIRNSSQSAVNTGPYTIAAQVPEPSFVAVTVSDWAPAQAGGSVAATVTTNQSSWSATSSASWLTISSRSGSTGKAITLTAARNPTTAARSAVATFTAGGAVAEVLVYQPGAVDDHGSDPAAATAWDLAAAATVSGSLELGDDLDYFVFTAPASGSYRFVSDATGNVSGYLYNSAATRIAYNLDSGPGYNFQITHTLTAGQVYYLAIRNSSQSTSNTGAYTISATRL